MLQIDWPKYDKAIDEQRSIRKEKHRFSENNAWEKYKIKGVLLLLVWNRATMSHTQKSVSLLEGDFKNRLPLFCGWHATCCAVPCDPIIATGTRSDDEENSMKIRF